MRSLIWGLCLSVVVMGVAAQTEFSFVFSDKQLTDDKPIKLQAYEYRPDNWNGKVILFHHGAAGTVRGFDSQSVKESIKYWNISRFALANGYIFVPYMRKGRGRSEGVFTEENTGSCAWGTNEMQQKEALLQIEQVIDQVKSRYGVSKVILMGHSRGGFIVSRYASEKPENVMAIVNLAGHWNASCERYTGNQNRDVLAKAASKFKPQFWAYFENDSYFKTGLFNDWDYSWLKKTASDNGVVFKVFSPSNRAEGHDAPTWTPEEWSKAYFPLLNALPRE